MDVCCGIVVLKLLKMRDNKKYAGKWKNRNIRKEKLAVGNLMKKRKALMR